MEAGAFSTFKENAGCSNTGKYVGYSLSMSQVQSKGISAASASYGNIEPDGYANAALDGNVSVYPVSWLKLGLNARYNSAKTDIDNWGGIGGDDPNNVINAEDIYVRGYAHIALLENKAWVQDIGYAYTKQDQKNNNDIDSAHPAEYMRSSFHANTWKTDWKHTITLLPLQTIVAGVDIHHEEGSSLYYSISSYGPYSSVIGKKIMDIYSGYIQDVFSLNDRLYLTYGVRLDNNSKFNTKLTGRATAAYYQKDLCNGLDVKLKGTAGTGFKAPSLYQLYSEYGDTMLNPENSIGYDGGFEISGHNGSIHLNVVVFYNKYTDMIDYNTSTFMYANISSAESKGIETELSAKPIDCIDCAVHYTFTKTRNLETNEELLQRPQHTWGFDCGYHPYKGIFLNGNVQYVGKRFDYGYITMPSYTLLNLRASLDLNSHITLYGRIENLLDKQYEVTYGYGTPGRSAYGGVKVAF
jgi:vitamin B12 transporter